MEKNMDLRLFFHLFSMYNKAIETGQTAYLKNKDLYKYLSKYSLNAPLELVKTTLYVIISNGITSAINYMDDALNFTYLANKYFKRIERFDTHNFDISIIDKFTDEIIQITSKCGKSSITDRAKFIIHKLTNLPCSLKIVAENLEVNPKYLARAFKNNTGLTVGQYIVQTKMKIALRRLNAEDEVMTKIANDLGYDNYQAFYRAFKKIYKLSPMEYKKFSPAQKTKHAKPIF